MNNSEGYVLGNALENSRQACEQVHEGLVQAGADAEEILNAPTDMEVEAQAEAAETLATLWDIANSVAGG